MYVTLHRTHSENQHKLNPCSYVCVSSIQGRNNNIGIMCVRKIFSDIDVNNDL